MPPRARSIRFAVRRVGVAVADKRAANQQLTCRSGRERILTLVRDSDFDAEGGFANGADLSVPIFGRKKSRDRTAFGAAVCVDKAGCRKLFIDLMQQWNADRLAAGQ